MSEASPSLPLFRIFFHGGKTIVLTAGNSLLAEQKARVANPGGFVKKINLVKDARK